MLRWLLLGAVALSANLHGFERTEERAPCADFQPQRQALFGDLHVHTRFSFDAYISSMRRDPWDAYRYAKGEAITLPGPDGEQTLSAQIQRPLDFTAVTDHGEYLGPIAVCTEDAGRLGYWWPHCSMTRANNLWVQLYAASWWSGLSGQKEEGAEQSFACTLSDCESAGQNAWSRIQQAAEDHYDRTERCEFTTFVAYEYTDSPMFQNMHRNVVFRNERVTDMPISTYDTGRYNFPALWEGLRTQCTEAGTGCDVISIPHNSNLAGGLMFRDPRNEQELRDRLAFEPVVELVQHKGASECRYDRLAGVGLDTEDELCDFEQVVADNLSMLGSVNGIVRAPEAAPVPIERFERRNMVRNALKDGLLLGQRDGVNPFVMGFIGSSDTHSASPGGVEEDNYTGHLGRRDSGYRNVQDHFFSNPGGHAVVWAEENSRDAIFAALKRKETYATSGTRPIVRLFAAEELPADLCEDSDAIETGYARGVPMGGELRGVEQVQIFVSAQKDPGIDRNPGTDLQRVQIVKGWVDEAGAVHEQVIDVAGNAANGAGVDPSTCARVGSGAASLCAVWTDPKFDASQRAFYYARVLENPTCRWSTLQCQSAGVNPFHPECSDQAARATEQALEGGDAVGDVYGKCCIDPKQEPFYSPTIQERAWTSPVWVTPNA